MSADNYLDKLYDTLLAEETDDSVRSSIAAVRAVKDNINLPVELINEDISEAKEAPLHAQIKEMGIPQKIKLALLGNQMARGLLIRETNKQIPLFVLQNPRLTENEVYEFARNANLNEQVFRTIAGNAQWMKSPSVKYAIVSNPKTPMDVSIKWVKYLQVKELRNLAKSKNIPQVVVTQSRKLLEKHNK
jgi:hypothetical protein